MAMVMGQSIKTGNFKMVSRFIAVQLSLALHTFLLLSLSFSPASSGFPEDKLGRNTVRIKTGIHCLSVQTCFFPCELCPAEVHLHPTRHSSLKTGTCP